MTTGNATSFVSEKLCSPISSFQQSTIPKMSCKNRKIMKKLLTFSDDYLGMLESGKLVNICIDYESLTRRLKFSTNFEVDNATCQCLVVNDSQFPSVVTLPLSKIFPKPRKSILYDDNLRKTKDVNRKAKLEALNKSKLNFKVKKSVNKNNKFSKDKKEKLLELIKNDIEHDMDESYFSSKEDFLRILEYDVLVKSSCKSKSELACSEPCLELSCKQFSKQDLDKHLLKSWSFYEIIKDGKSAVNTSYIGWDQNVIKKEFSKYEKDTENQSSKNKKKPIIAFKQKHIDWCFVCGKSKDNSKSELIIECTECTARFHSKCTNPHSKCPQCSTGGCIKSHKLVWHKMANYPWWPARVLETYELPGCLRSPPTNYHIPIKYFGENKYAWADIRRICEFRADTALLASNKKNYDSVMAILEYVATLK